MTRWMWMPLVLVLAAAGCVADPDRSKPDEPLTRASSEVPSASNARNSAKIHVELGTAYLQAGRYGVALDEAKIAITTDPAYAAGHLLTALIYASIEQFGQARSAFEEAIRLSPGDPEVNNAYGWFLCSQDRPKEGLALLEQAARNPYYSTPTRAWTNAGLCLLRSKDLAGAEERFLRAVQADGGNALPAVHLANIAYQTGRYARARQLLSQALELIQKPTAELLWLGARIEKKLGDKNAQESFGAKLRNSYPNSEECQLYLQGKFE